MPAQTHSPYLMDTMSLINLRGWRLGTFWPLETTRPINKPLYIEEWWLYVCRSITLRIQLLIWLSCNMIVNNGSSTDIDTYIIVRFIMFITCNWLPKYSRCSLCPKYKREDFCRAAVNTLRPKQNGRHFADDIFKCIFLNENVWIPIRITLKFVPRVKLTQFQYWFR